MSSRHIRLNPHAETPRRYRGILDLPSGRYASIRAQVVDEAGGKFFITITARAASKTTVFQEKAS